jgi:hypothetical protein
MNCFVAAPVYFYSCKKIKIASPHPSYMHSGFRTKYFKECYISR